MKSLKVFDDKHKSLRKVSTPLTFPLEKHVIDLGLKMRQYLINSQDPEYIAKHKSVRTGVGLAAPQIGKNIRMFAVYFVNYINEQEIIYDYVIVNPVVTKRSDKLIYLKDGEGCLSVPDNHEGYVYRNNDISINGFDIISGKDVSLDLEGYPAIVFQHEFDHLNGILYYDHIKQDDPFEVLNNAIVI